MKRYRRISSSEAMNRVIAGDETVVSFTDTDPTRIPMLPSTYTSINDFMNRHYEAESLPETIFNSGICLRAICEHANVLADVAYTKWGRDCRVTLSITLED
jgi:hypothetical protein